MGRAEINRSTVSPFGSGLRSSKYRLRDRRPEPDCPDAPLSSVTFSVDSGTLQRVSSPEPISVACLVLLDSERWVLAAQRPSRKVLSGCWEFPGGKVEVAETPEDALRREIREELGFAPGELQPLNPAIHAYSFGTIRRTPFLSRCHARPSLRLHEHAAIRWVARDALDQLTWVPADLPIVAQLPQLI